MVATNVILLCYTLIFFHFLVTSIAEDSLTINQTIKDDGKVTLISAGGVFQLGFFSPRGSENRYLGIWYKKISTGTVVWVANRETPVFDTSGILRLDQRGNLGLTNGANSVVWSSNSSRAVVSPVAQLLDNGNLVIRYDNGTDPESYFWQSFDHPGDHLLPGMKLGWDLSNGVDWYLNSWRNADDPSPGNYTIRMNLEGYPQPLVWRGSVVQLRFGPWDGNKFSGTAFTNPNPAFISTFTFDQNEIYYRYQISSSSAVFRGLVNLDGNFQVLLWINQTQSWQTLMQTQKDECDQYAICGAYGACNINRYQLGENLCECLQGFEPKFPERWKNGDWSDGCVRIKELACEGRDAFIKYEGQKLPDTRNSWFNESMDLDDCSRTCLNNCSCTAYSNIDIREGGVGCMLWLDDLLDIRDYREDVQDLYVRVAASELEESGSSRANRRVRIVVIVVSVVSALLLGLFMIHVLKKRKLRKEIYELDAEIDAANANEREDLELPLFEFLVIANATNHFSHDNKLGEGGFGPVYKGTLKDGQEIAVKRLSQDSTQGLDEFKTEVSIIAKLQHRNLVRLLGCCIEKAEMLLVYEYMPNKSLDSFIFDKELSQSLDWPTRYNIINGIARGLLYLHQDSRLRIVHRDLKTSNILLDHEMNPRISDFGLARSFGGSESVANTTRVVGTYGYMSPEYALDGIFSVKSDVYSFGVLVLEIVSGTKMRGFYHPDPNLNLLGHAWRLFEAGNCLELIDEAILESCNESKVFRAIQIGLLCVQPYPEDRPSMSLVVMMLSSEIEVPQPKQPSFFIERTPVETDISRLCHFSSSTESKALVSPR